MNTLTSQEYSELMHEREAYREDVEIADALERLDKHTDFQLVFRNFLLTKLLRKTSVDWAKSGKTEYELTMRSLLQLELMLNTIKENGTIARQQLESIEAFEHNLLNEE